MKFLKTVAGAAVSSLWETVSGNVVVKDTSADVGIGTDDPGYPLEVQGANGSTAITGSATVAISDGDADDEYSILRLATSSDGGLVNIGAKATTTGAYPNSVGQLEIAVQNGGSMATAMTIAAAGNVGIGGATTITENFQIGDTTEDYFFQLSKNQLKFNRGGASYIDQSVADGSLYFRTTASSAGDTNTMIIASDGAITKPAQPAFLVNPSSGQNDIDINTTVTIVFDVERFDQGGDFASNTFTAPVTGRYQLNWDIRLNNIDSGAGYYMMALVTSNATYETYVTSSQFAGDVAYWSCTGAVLADMDAADTAHLTLYQSAGSAQTDISAGLGSTFSGFLAC